MTVTRAGVCYNLKESPFIFPIGKYNFHFSSSAHMRKFYTELQKKCEWLNDSLSNRFKFNLEVDVLAIFNWYRQVETRGFYIYDGYEGCEYTCPGNITFRGIKPSCVNSIQPLESITTQSGVQ